MTMEKDHDNMWATIQWQLETIANVWWQSKSSSLVHGNQISKLYHWMGTESGLNC